MSNEDIQQLGKNLYFKVSSKIDANSLMNMAMHGSVNDEIAKMMGRLGADKANRRQRLASNFDADDLGFDPRTVPEAQLDAIFAAARKSAKTQVSQMPSSPNGGMGNMGVPGRR
jgi:hypothetical protein